MDYYNILGVPKEASQDDIKKAYRKLAMTHHPDRGGDLATFQRINEAYDTLGDVEKRAKYDQPAGQFPNDFSFDGSFNNMFGEMFNNIFRQNANQRAQSLYRTQLSISLLDAYHGKEQVIQLRVKNDLKTLSIKIPRGIESGYSVKYDLLDNTTLIIDFIIMDDTRFQRRGKDLYSTVNVSVLDLIGGGKLKFATISGEILDVSIPSKTQPTSKIKLSGQGMHLQNGTVGDQYLLIQTFIPDNITDELIEYIKDYNKKDNT